MANQNDDIVIKRVRRKQEPNNSNETPGNRRRRQSDPVEEKKNIYESQYRRHIKVLSVLLILISILILIAIISYTPKDEANTQVTFRELINLLRGKEDALLKAQSTKNWLGLLGAVISNFLINGTIGYAVITIPFLVAYWSKYLYLLQVITSKPIKFTLLILIYILSFSTFCGILSYIPWLGQISREWPGSFGYFTATILTGFSGTIGSLAIVLIIWGMTTVIGFRISLSKILEGFKVPLSNISNWFKKLKSEPKEIKAKVVEQPTATTNYDASEEEEPARIFKRNTEFADNQEDDAESEIIDPLKDPLKAFSQKMKTESKSKDIEIIKYPTDVIVENVAADEISEVGEIVETKPFDFVENEENEENEDGIFTDEGTDEDYEEMNPGFHTGKKKLILTVTEPIINEPDELAPINLLSTNIHDEEIDYKPPTINLLIDDEDKFVIDENELKQNARILQEKLETFKIFIENLSVTPGPVVTQYEFVPAAGIKISRIEALSDDIAMALKAKGIRIIAPIPGKGTVGIEIPNQNPALVRFSSVLKSTKFHSVNFRLPIGLGKTISGEVFTADLAKMPHLLIAGATGTGKSVGINTIITSLLYKMHPRNLKFVIIDPKKVELTQYNRLEKHFLATSPDLDNTIITDPQEAVIILKALCAEMDLRYDILAHAGQRNLIDYNIKVKEGKLRDDKELVHKAMPYIVVIIDELADLMLTASKEVESPIIRLAQLARAVGIHLVVATQRPSVDVITGIIKANFPARLSYLVASKVDSRTILDMMGAEKLLGNGDLLFQYGGSNAPLRIQNAFLSTEEVEDLCSYIGNQDGFSKPYMLPSLNEGKPTDGMLAKEDRDVLFEEAAKLVVRLQQASVSLLQRRLKVGYARAGRIVDELEACGIIGPFDGSKARLVLIETEDELERII
jgi:S-DNA-T family DNA segregation ATPase FtsK/SpoIIIE